MDRKQWARVREVFRAALACDPGERGALLDRECGEDAELRARVEAYLGADQEIGEEFLEPLAGLSLRPAHTAPTDDRLVGTRIGQYTLTRVLSSGGMGTVYEAEQEQPRRTVAVKVMRAGLASPVAQRRFEYESEILASLRHPGIAQVYEAGTHQEKGGPGLPYFAMEYIPDARTITEYARDAKLGIRERLRLFVQVCDAVHHGHRKGIIHRDLKPGNILVDAHRRVKIIDFGVARATNSDVAATTAHTDVGQLLGTLQYMSPEQCDADPHQLDTRSDVYALGVVLYELLCERLPYDVHGAPIHEAARVIREETPPRPSTTDRRLRGDVETIVLKALEKDRDRRYPSADELGRDIERYLAGAPIQARPPSALYQLRKFARRHWVVVGGIASLIVVLVVGLIISTTLYFEAQDAREKAGDALTESERARGEADRARMETEVALGEAEKEAESARSINDFLTGMLESLRLPMNPPDGLGVSGAPGAVRPGNEYAVAEMLRSTLPRIDEAFAGKPELEAKMRETIGVTFHSLGLYDDARRQIESALEIRRNSLGEEHPDTVDLWVSLGIILCNAREVGEDVETLRPAYEAARRILGEEHETTLKAAEVLAAALSQRGAYAESNALYAETIETKRRVFGAEHSNTLNAMCLFAASLAWQRRYHESCEIGERIYEAASNPEFDDDYVKLVAMHLMGECAQKFCDHRRAVEILRPALEKSEKLYGEKHPQTVTIARTLALSLNGEDEVDEREGLFRRVIDGFRAMGGGFAAYLKEVDREYASFLESQGRTDEVIGFYRDGLRSAIEAQKLAPEDYRAIFVLDGAMEQFASIALNGGLLEEGETWTRRWVEFYASNFEEDDDATQRTLVHASRMLWAAGRRGAARELLERRRSHLQRKLEAGRATADVVDVYARFLLTCEAPDLRDPEAALEAAKKVVDFSNRKHPSYLETLSIAYEKTGSPELALEAQREAVALRPEENGKYRCGGPERRLVGLLIRSGALDEATGVVEEMDRACRNRLGTDSELYGTTLRDHARMLVDEGQFVLAEKYARDWLHRCQAGSWGGRSWRTAYARCMIGRSLAGQGRFEDAEPLLVEGVERILDNPVVDGDTQHAVLGWIIREYEDWGKPDQAAEWRAKDRWKE